MKNKIIKVFSVLLIMSLMLVKVNAKVSFVGETVNQEGEYNSTIFVAGNKVTDSSNVDGIKFVAGNTLETKGQSPYGFFAGNIVTINSNVEKDLFVAGNSVTIGSEATLGRDVYLAASTIKINTNITRNLYAGGSSIDIRGIAINGNASLYAEEILLDENTIIEGKLTYPKETKIEGLESAKIGSVVVKEIKDYKKEASIQEKIWSFILSVFAGYIVLIALFRFIPSAKTKLDNIELSIDEVAKKGCIGIIVLIVVPLISLFALISGILSPLAIIVLLIYGISIYLSSLVVSYLIGKIILEKIFKNNNIYIMMLVGVFVLRLAGIIPAIGGFISAVALFYGMGLIYKFINNKKEVKAK